MLLPLKSTEVCPNPRRAVLVLLSSKSTRLCQIFGGVVFRAFSIKKEHRTLANFLQSSFRAFSLKKKHRTLPVYTGQSVLASRSIKESRGWGVTQDRQIPAILQISCCFPSRGHTKIVGIKNRRIASFERADIASFQRSRSKILALLGSIGPSHRSSGQIYCKIPGRVRKFQASIFGPKSS